MRPEELRYDAQSVEQIDLAVLKSEITERKRAHRDAIALLQRAIQELEDFEHWLRSIKIKNK